MGIYLIGFVIAFIESVYFYNYRHRYCKIFNPTCHCLRFSKIKKLLLYIFSAMYSWIAVLYISFWWLIDLLGEDK